MNSRLTVTVWLVLIVLGVGSTSAQTPRVVRFSGMLRDGAGEPRTGAASLTFTIYAEAEGGTPLWSETQAVTLDADGRYAVTLGGTIPEGLPLELFAQGDARWLGVAVDGQTELTRVSLVSVPYALKAADADTVGGKPLSAFVLAGPTNGTGADGLTYLNTGLLSRATPGANSGDAGYIGMFGNTTDLVNSVMFQNGTSLGVNTQAPASSFHVMAPAAPAVYFDVYNNSLGALPAVNRAARGTATAPAAVQTADILGGLAVRGFGETTFGPGVGQVMFRAAEPFTDTARGTSLQMTTTPIGSSLWEERLRIDPSGNVGIGTVTPAQKLSVAGTIESTTGGFKFPDGTVQTTAGGGGGLTGITAGPGITVTGGAPSPTVGASFLSAGGDYGLSAGVARGDHLHDGRYLRLSGGTLSGGLSAVGLSSVSNAVGAHAVEGVSANGAGIYGASTGGFAGLFAGLVGIYPTSTAGLQVTTASAAPGVQVSNSSVNGLGISSTANATGAHAVEGISASGAGIFGASTGGFAGLFSGLVGIYPTTTVGLQVSTAAAGPGIQVTNTNASGQGISSVANGAGAHAVEGISAGGAGIYGASASGAAGLFSGEVAVLQNAATGIGVFVSASGSDSQGISVGNTGGIRNGHLHVRQCKRGVRSDGRKRLWSGVVRSLHGGGLGGLVRRRRGGERNALQRGRCLQDRPPPRPGAQVLVALVRGIT